MLTLVTAVLVSLLYMAGGATAVASADLTAEGTPRLVGTISATTSDGVLLLGAEVGFDGRAGEFAGAAETVRMRHVVLTDSGTEDGSVGPVPLGGVSLVQAEPQVDYANATTATLRIEPTANDMEIFVRVRDGSGAVTADFGRAELPSLQHTFDSSDYTMGSRTSAPDHHFADTIADASVVLSANGPTFASTFSALEKVDLRVGGTATMMVIGARVTMESPDGRWQYDSGAMETRTAGTSVSEARTEFIVLELTGANLTSSVADEPFRLFAESLTLDVTGTMDLAAATGSLRTPAGRSSLDSDDATLEGVLSTTLALRHGTEQPDPTNRYSVSANDGAVESSLDASGEFRVAVLNGQNVAAPVATGLTVAEKAAVGVGLGALLLGALVAAKKFLLPALGLFARPEPLHPVLENPLRMRLHGLVNAYPGIHGRRLQSLAQIATGTFEHHMRSLLQASLVREERIGGRVLYAPCEPDAPRPKVDRDELAIRALLMTEARRRVAEAIAQGPKTQRELVDVLQLPQQTVSFHVKALLDHKVIAASDGRPASYSANPEYVDLITGASSLGEQQGILSRVLQRVRGSPSVEASAAS